MSGEKFMAMRHAMQANKKVTDAASGLQDLIESAEDLLESVQDQQGAAAEKLREKVSETVRSARTRLSELDVSEMASDAVDGAVGFLRSDPWRTVAIGALAVLAISLLVRGSSAD
jgi:ElaB/YqjD/DUF883 family membrane-anchored ribosome-binding protein